MSLCLTLALASLRCADGAGSPHAACIAPANPGGGWDLTCRATAEVLAAADSLAGAMDVSNLPGEGGAIAFGRVVQEMRGDERVIVAASPSTLLGIAQGHYGPVTERDVRWVAAVATEPSVLAVREDAPWPTLEAFAAEWRRNPDSVVVGGGSVVGGQDHIKALLLARAAGVDLQRVRYLPLSGPYEAIDSLRSGGIQLFPGDVSEVRRLVESRRLRLLAVLAENRAGGSLAEVPTAREAGIDVTWEVWRGFYAPSAISTEAYDAWILRLRSMTTMPAWKAVLDRNGLTPFFLAGEEFEQFVASQTSSFRTVSEAIGVVRSR